jgi:hypothetical protein
MVNNKQPRGRPLSCSRANCAWWLGTRHWFVSYLAVLSLIYASGLDNFSTPCGCPDCQTCLMPARTCKLRMADYGRADAVVSLAPTSSLAAH